MKNIFLLLITLLCSKSLSESPSLNACDTTVSALIIPTNTIRAVIDNPQVKNRRSTNKKRDFIETVYNIRTFTESNRYISIEGTPARIIEIDEQNRLIVEEGIWTRKRRTITRSELRFFISSVRFEPELRTFFQQQENFPREVKAFNIPKTDQEALLKSEGFTSAFYSGVDAVLYWNQVGQKMKEALINPYQTHIEELARHVSSHVDFMREGFLNRTDISPQQRSEMLSLLNQFFEEAQQKIEEKGLTYAYWLYWNQRLAILASPTVQKKNTHINTHSWQQDWWRTDASIRSPETQKQLRHSPSKENLSILHIQHILDQFPNEIVFHIPGKLGAIALVEASHRAIPFSLHHSFSQTKGLTMNAVQNTHYDYVHYFAGFGKLEWPYIIQSPISKEQLKKDFQEKIKALDTDQQRQAYIGMFLLMHDLPVNINIQKPQNILRMFTINTYAFKDENNLGYLLPDELLSFIQSDFEVQFLGGRIIYISRVKRQALKQYLEESAEVFSNIINQILAEHSYAH